MAKPRKSSFYHTRWNRCGLNVERAAEVIGCTVEDVLKFDNEGAPIAERLLLLWDRKNVNLPGWSGWCFSRGVLRHGNKQWRPENILASREQSVELDKLQAELRQAKSIKGSLSALKASALRLALRG